MKINVLEKVNINNSDQWLLIRSKKENAPLILHVQAGPGLPIIPEADTMEKLLNLEEHFIVVYWDQRGCGKSFNKNIDPKSINLSQMTDDIIECTKYLLNKFHRDRGILAGYSIGATISLMAAKRNSSIFNHLFLAGIDIDIPVANKYALEYSIMKAKELSKSSLLKQIIKLNNRPIIESKVFQERAKLLADLGGIKTGSSYKLLLMSTIKNMLTSKAYSFKDILKTIKGTENPKGICRFRIMPIYYS